MVVQGMWRARAQRRYARAQKARLVHCQAMMRGFMARRRFARLKQTVLLVQRAFRAKIAGRKARKQYLELRDATLRIQTFWRRYQVQKIATLRREAAVITKQRKFRAILISIEE